MHIANVATGGPPNDIVDHQLARADPKTADIVVIADDNMNAVSETTASSVNLQEAVS